MSTIRDLGIRARLVLLTAVAMAPLLVLMLGGIVFSYGDALEGARSEVRRAAAINALHLSAAFEDARVRLDSLRSLFESRGGRGATCNLFIGSVQSARRQFTTIGLIDRDGRVISCDGRNLEGRLVPDTDLAQQVLALEPGTFAVGHFIAAFASRNPSIVVAMPLAETPGASTGAIFATLDLDHLSSVVREISEEGRRSVVLMEAETARVLARWPDPLPFGTPVPEHPALSLMHREPDGGAAELADLDGTLRIFGTAPVVRTPIASIALAIGEARDDTILQVNRRSILALALAGLALACACGGAAWLGARMLVRPIRRLMRGAARIGSGDYRTPVELEAWHAPEYRELSATLNTMALRLEKGRSAEKEMAVSEARYRLVAENTADMITCIGEDGLRTFVSGASYNLLGYRPDELLERRPYELAHPDDLPIVFEFGRRLRAGEAAPAIRYRARHRKGHHVWVEASGRQIEGSRQYVLAVRDASHRKAMEDHLEEANLRLARLASIDDLTGLANRRTFNQSLLTELARCARARMPLGLVLIDVDRFKAYNDGYGHQAGDDCLQRVAACLAGQARRPGDLVARYGGEEFVAILPDAHLPGALALAEAMRRAVRDMAIVHGGSEHGRVTVSIGVACLPDPSEESDDAPILRQADQALYAAKARGRDAVEAFHSGMVEEGLRRPA